MPTRFMLTISFIGYLPLIPLINGSNSQSIDCSNGNEAITTAGNELQIRGVLCADDSMIYIDLQYPNYDNNWFGIVFSENMYGDALIWTIGKSEETPRAQALYAYTNTDASPNQRSAGVTYEANDDWIEHFTNNTGTNGIRIIYKTRLSDTPWNMSTPNIKIGYAFGDPNVLTLNYHSSQRNDAGDVSTLEFTESASPPSTTLGSTGDKGCDAQDLLPTTTTTEDLTITLFIDCSDDSVRVTIKCAQYNNNWFGIVFANDMLGSALIYTIGKASEQSRETGLYSYTLSGRSIADVTYDGMESDWDRIRVSEENGVLTVEYEQSELSKTVFTRETETVPIRWAKGDSLTLAYHYTDRSSETQMLDLVTGSVQTIKDDLSLEIAHGIIMWVTWAVLAPIGIMSSAFRYLYTQSSSKWFGVHRAVQSMVVILCVVGFVIAIVFTQKKGKTHFDNSHAIIGLTVIVLSVLQPINACFRPHSPENGWPNNVKSVRRIVWEYVHKISGYSAWILGCVAAMLGMQILGEDILAYVHMFGWCGLLLLSYAVLFGIGCRKSKLNQEMRSVNETPGGDSKAREKLVGNESS